MNEELLAQYKAKLCEVMKAFIAFCDEHGLTYFAGGGTAIGAMRHQGFIPWDDDIDVYMLRPDYEKFLSLRNKLSDTKYEIVDVTNDSYPLQTFAKFSDMTTTVWEYRDSPYIVGTWVDVFPLDEASDKLSKEEEDLAIKYNWAIDYHRRACHKHSIRSLWEDLRQLPFKEFLSCLTDVFYYSPRKKQYLKEIFACEKEIRKIKGDQLYCYPIHNMPTNKVYKKEWFGGVYEVPFEDFQIKVCKGVHEYLTARFGDYMQLPPVEQRQSHHGLYYINLEERLSVKEVQDKLKKK